jgi:hypothetical protein
MRLCPPLTSFRKRQNGFFWKETKPSLNIPFCPVNWPENGLRASRFVKALCIDSPRTGVSPTALQGPYPDRGKTTLKSLGDLRKSLTEDTKFCNSRGICLPRCGKIWPWLSAL